MPTQRDLHQQLASDYRTSHQRVASLVRPLDPEQLVRRPTAPEWSVAEVLEHLVLMDELFLRAVEPLVRGGRADAGAPARSWSPSFIGRKITEALEQPKKLRSARSAMPLRPRGGIAEAFLADDTHYARLMDEAGGLDWAATRLPPPVMPWLPLKMNLGDVFVVRRAHVRRHAGQIERIISRTGDNAA